MAKNKIDDRIIERAVELWIRALRQPKFDNGDKGFNGAITMGLCNINATAAKNDMQDFEGQLEKFRKILVNRLKFLRDNDDKPKSPEDIAKEKSEGRSYAAERYYTEYSLGCDYHPGTELRNAAESAGISESLFSIKSSVDFYGCKYVTARFGYQADSVYHHPLPDGRWLITRLYGEDMEIIKNAVLDGRLPELQIE